MKQLAISVAMLAVVGGGVWLRAQAPRPLDVQLKAAERKEDIEGDLRGAIADYKRLAETENRAVAAKALVRLGDVYEKLGNVDPKPHYERVVNHFADQRESAATARARLDQLARPASAKLRTERVLNRSDGSNRVSPDGRFIAMGDDDENIVLHEIATGKTRALTTDGIPTDPEHRYPLDYVFSRDGRQLAYAWYFEKDDRTVLRIVSTAEGAPKTPRTLHDSGRDMFGTADWSPDGQWISGLMRRSDGVAQIGVINVNSGQFRGLKTVEWSRVGGLRFSADSKWLAYHRPHTDASFERDVFVLAVDGTTETAVAQSPADDTVLEWTPDGKRLLIASDRGGTMSIWSASIGGSLIGSVDLVRPDIGIVSSIGPTRDGTLFYNLRPSSADIYIAQFDLATGQLASRPVRLLQQFKGANSGGAWSADGTRLAFVSRREAGPRFIVPILSIKTGTIERELTPALTYGGTGQWSPDGSRFLVRGSDLKGRDGILTVDAQSGEVRFLVGADVCSGIPYWARDGKSFFCFDLPPDAPEQAQIVQVDLATLSVLRKYPSRTQGAGVSPDGRFILLGGSEPRVLSLLDLTTGLQRVLLSSASNQTRITNFNSVTWVPDGRSVVFNGLLNGEEAMWLVPIDGSAPHKIAFEVGIDSVVSMRFNPKTAQVVFTAANPNLGSSLELWKLENLFPTYTSTAGGPR